MSRALEDEKVNSQEKIQRIPLGQRSKAKANETRARIVGDEPRLVLDVAAFNSFVG